MNGEIIQIGDEVEYYKYDDALEAVWRILNGMGYSLRHNERLAVEVDAVLSDYPVESFEPVTKCGNCKHWSTGIAYTAVGKCKLHDRITNKNYFCGDGKEKDD